MQYRRAVVFGNSSPVHSVVSRLYTGNHGVTILQAPVLNPNTLFLAVPDEGGKSEDYALVVVNWQPSWEIEHLRMLITQAKPGYMSTVIVFGLPEPNQREFEKISIRLMPRPITEAEAGKWLHPRVLLIDDEPAVLNGLAQGLERLGFDVDYALNTEEGTAVLVSAPSRPGVDLIVSDCDVEELRAGVEFFTQTRKLDGYENTPFFLMSGRDAIDQGIPNLAGPPTGFLQKPFQPLVLARALEEALLMNQPAVLG